MYAPASMRYGRPKELLCWTLSFLIGIFKLDDVSEAIPAPPVRSKRSKDLTQFGP
jgi:hypothetical protein